MPQVLNSGIAQYYECSDNVCGVVEDAHMGAHLRAKDSARPVRFPSYSGH